MDEDAKAQTMFKHVADQVAICMLEEDADGTKILLVPKSTFESELRKHAPEDIGTGFEDLTAWFLKQIKKLKGRDDSRRSAHNKLWAAMNDWCEDEDNCLDLYNSQLMSPFCFLTVNADDE